MGVVLMSAGFVAGGDEAAAALRLGVELLYLQAAASRRHPLHLGIREENGEWRRGEIQKRGLFFFFVFFFCGLGLEEHRFKLWVLQPKFCQYQKKKLLLFFLYKKS